ncbi:MAG: YkvA family protein, partial [Dolichospermum sp.]
YIVSLLIFSIIYFMDDFLKQVKRFIGFVTFTIDAIAMYFCMIDSQTPAYAKATIAAALTYFISPADAIPDWIAGIGFTDDAGVIATALGTIRAHVKDEHWKKADDFFNS